MNIQTVSTVLVSVNQNPSILNPDFLKYNQIVPMEWNLGKPPFSTSSVSQVFFDNGFSIIVQGDKITFLQSFEPDDFSVEVIEITSKYVEAVPYLNYRAIGINFNGYVVLETVENASDFILNKIIAPGTWRSFQGVSPNNAEIQFTYPLSDAVLALTIQAGSLEDKCNNKVAPILLFSANFHRELNTDETQKLEVKRITQSWEKDFSVFSSLVESIALGS